MPAVAPASKPRPEPAVETGAARPAASAHAREAGAGAGLPVFLQRKAAPNSVKVNAPDDHFEREADQAADVVMRKCACGGSSTLASTPCAACQAEEGIQRKTAFPELPDATAAFGPKGQPDAATAPATEGEPAGEAGALSPGAAPPKAAVGKAGVVSLPDAGERQLSEDPLIQTKADSSGGSASHGGSEGGGSTGGGLASSLSRNKGTGHSLDSRTQSEMEGHFNRDFSDVRVHTGAEASQMNRGVSARAFTHGRDIYFNTGEYNPQSDSGKHLLAHELTHTAQQGAAGDRIQRFSGPEHAVVTEPRPVVPNDGAEVTGRMNDKITNDPDVQEGADLDEEERREKEKPDRAKVKSESRAINAAGETSPSVDRPAAAQDKTAEQKAAIDEQVQARAAEKEKKEKAAGKEKGAKLTEAEAAAQAAEAAQQAAFAVEIPTAPEPFRHPRIEEPVDSANEALPRNAPIDTQVRGLGYIGEMLREKGYELRLHAADQEMGAHGLESIRQRQNEDLANAKEGTAAMEAHNEARKEIAGQSHQAHAESVERQVFVAAKAPDLAAKADEGKTDSGDLAREARSKADQSKSEIPDDEDAREDAEKQSAEMSSTADGAASMDQAITQTAERARQYEKDAELAAEQNQVSDAKIAETDELTAQTGARVGDMHGKNAASQGRLDAAAAGPVLIRRHARRTAQSGAELIAATYVMETELISLQETYLGEMLAIESKEAATERLQREQEEASQAELSPEDQLLIELAGMNDEEQDARIATMEQGQRDKLLGALDTMIAQTPDEAAEPAAPGGRIKVDTGLSKALMGEQPPDPRAPKIQEVEKHRTDRLGGVLDVADQNMTFVTAEQQQMLANKLVAKSVVDDIGGIKVLQMGKEMLKGLIDPRVSLVGVIGGFEKTLGGLANIGNWEAWKKDPLGNLLQIAADVSTGLAMIFSSVLALAALITAVMVAFTILTWGLASPITMPVIAWMGTIMTYAGWGAIITGGLAVYFNYLAYIKNLHDAGTAETARDLFANTEEMKQNAGDGFQGAMAVVEGAAAVKMAPKMRSGAFFEAVPKSPGAAARLVVQQGRAAVGAVAAAPGKLAAGARRLLAGGKGGLIKFKDRIKGLFSRKRPGDIDMDTPDARRVHDGDLADAQGKKLSEMEPGQIRAEVKDASRHPPRRVDPNQPYHRDYDIEVESNGHTYRRRRDGRGWCRFSAWECSYDLPPDVRRATGIDDLDQELFDAGLAPDDALESALTKRARKQPKGKQAQTEAVADIRKGGDIPVRPIREGITPKRDLYLGKTPGKRKPTGEAVIKRMRAEGKITGTAPNELVYHQGTNRWYPIDECDMGHITDAVKYWNETGRHLGAGHKANNRWMKDPKNYELEPSSINRSRGALLDDEYLPPTV